MMNSPIQSESVRKVLDNPELLAKIISHLNNGEPRDLITTLQVSHLCFHASASTLCRRIEVPLYEYNSTKERDNYLVDRSCVSCDGEWPMPYDHTPSATCHRSLHPGLSRRHLERIHPTYRLLYPATETMKEMYKSVRTIIIEQHDGCDRLAETHPLPHVRTVIVRGGHNEVCTPSINGLMCGFLPRHPFRLVLDQLCTGMICRRCTSPNLLSEHVETLVLRFQYESPHPDCPTRTLPRHFNPKRLVLLFTQETVRHEFGRRDAKPNGSHLMAYAPGQGKRVLENTFYRLAKMILSVGDHCEIYIAGADNAALHVNGLEEHDNTLEKFEAMYPHREEVKKPVFKGYTLPLGAFWVSDNDQVQATRWMDSLGEVHHIDEILEFRGYDMRSGEQDMAEENERMEEDRPPSPDLRKSEVSPFEGYALPLKSHWILDTNQVEATRWRDGSGRMHHIDELLDYKYDSDEYGHDSDYYDGRTDRVGDAGSTQYACYDQYGQIISATKPRRIRQEDLPIARSIIEKRVSVMKDLVYKWIDHILDVGVPEGEDEYEDEYEERDGSIMIVEDKKWKRREKVERSQEEIEKRRMCRGRVQFISTYEYHRIEGNNDEMDDPNRYL